MSGETTFSLSNWSLFKVLELRTDTLKHPSNESGFSSLTREVSVRLLAEAGLAVLTVAGVVEAVVHALYGLAFYALSFIPCGEKWDKFCQAGVDNFISGTVHSGLASALSIAAIFFQPWDTSELKYMEKVESYFLP